MINTPLNRRCNAIHSLPRHSFTRCHYYSWKNSCDFWRD